MSKYRLRLYVTGQTSKSGKAIANIREMLEQDFPGEYELEVIDILEQPDMAEEAKVIATPALIRELPPPLRRVIGDLSDRDRVLWGLELKTSSEARDGSERRSE